MIWTGIAAVVMFYVACSIIQIIAAVRKDYNKSALESPQPTAPTFSGLFVAQGIFSLSTDFYILIIPIHLVVRLNLPLYRKIGVCGLFLTGLS